jgi:DNA repair exonuclease SbcCD nuclease subunit
MVPTILHASDTLAFPSSSEADAPVDLGGLDLVVRRAIDRDVDAVVHTGNLVRSPEPDADTVEAVHAALDPLREAGIPFFLVAGSRETTSSDETVQRLREHEAVEALGASPVRIDDIALYGVDHVESGREFEERLAALEPVEDYTYNVIACHQRIWPPLTESDADISAFDAMETTEVFVDDVLAGGTTDPMVWENDDFDYCVTYAGSTNPRHRDDEVPTATLIEATTDEHRHERIPLTTAESAGEIEHLRDALDHEPADLAGADLETLADRYGLAARAKDLFDERWKAIRGEILDRVHEDTQIRGEYATVTRTTSRRRVPKDERTVFEALRRAGVNPYDVLDLDSSALRELSDEGRVEDEAVFDREERTYVRVSDTEV